MGQKSLLHIALISSEVTPFAQTGGLGEMVGSLAPALQRAGAKPFFIMPRYRSINGAGWKQLSQPLLILVGGRSFKASIWKGKHHSGVTTYAIDIPEFFDRPALYGEAGEDYPDNCPRFVAFCRGAIAAMKKLRLHVDIIHAHDWETALVPFYLKVLYRKDPFFRNSRSLFTIHNLGYQGLFLRDDFPALGLDWSYFTPRYLEFYQKLSLLKAGIISTDALTTVSPTYAQEILSAEFGYGLVGCLQDRARDLSGILNGIDDQEWNPAADSHLAAAYTTDDLAGKRICKREFQKEMGLPVDEHIPLIAKVNRMVYQKGLDLVAELLPSLAAEHAQWVFVGQGEPELEAAVIDLAKRFPTKVAVNIGYDAGRTHRAVAAADFLLMPSQYEPCGLAQLYGMRYGAIPIARAVGGLADTVHDIDAGIHGTGFLFHEGTAAALGGAVRRALRYYEENTRCRSLQARIMTLDHSWHKPALAYLHLYRKILTAPPTEIPPGPPSP